jgi:HTH-type transcriptional regulator/antitoxin HigA
MTTLLAGKSPRVAGRAIWRRTVATPGSYLALIREFPLIPIGSEEHYDASLAVLDRLAVRTESSLDAGEAAYLAALTQFVQDYEQQHHAIMTEALSPLEMLRHLMKQTGLTPADLGRIIGNRGLASQILLGKRTISKANIRKIADYFHINPGALL